MEGIEKLRSAASRRDRYSRTVRTALRDFADILQNGQFYNTRRSPIKGYKFKSDIERFKYLLQPANNPSIPIDTLADLFMELLKVLEENTSGAEGPNGPGSDGDLSDEALQKLLKHLDKLPGEFVPTSYALGELVRTLLKDNQTFEQALECLLALLSHVEGDLYEDGPDVTISTVQGLQTLIEVYKDPLIAPIKILRLKNTLDSPPKLKRDRDPSGDKCLVLLIDSSYSMTEPRTKLLLLSYLLDWAKQTDVKCYYAGYLEGSLVTPIMDLASSDPASVLEFQTSATQTIRALCELIETFPKKYPIFSSYTYVVFTDDQDEQVYSPFHVSLVERFVSRGGKFHVFKCESAQTLRRQNLKAFCEKYGGTYVETFV